MRRGKAWNFRGSPALQVPSRRSPVHLDPALPLRRSKPLPSGPTLGGEPLPLQHFFHQPLDLSQLWVFPFHLQDSQIPIRASMTELGDSNPDSVLRLLLLEGKTQGDTKQSHRDSTGKGCGGSSLSHRLVWVVALPPMNVIQ